MTTRRGRPPKSIDPDELAAILAYAELEGDQAASDKFHVAARTLQRHRARLRAGGTPIMAALVTQKKKETTERCADQLAEVYERGLVALGRRLDDVNEKTRMKDRDLVGAIHILGNQRVTRDVLTGDEHQPPSSDRPGEGAAEARAGAARTPPGGGAPARAGSDGLH